MFYCCCITLHRHQLHLISYGFVSLSLCIIGIVFTIFAVFQKDSVIGRVWLAGPVLMVVSGVLCGKVMIDWGPAMAHGRNGSLDSRAMDEYGFPNLMTIGGDGFSMGNEVQGFKAPLLPLANRFSLIGNNHLHHHHLPSIDFPSPPPPLMTVGRSLSSSSIVVVEEEEEVCGGGAEEGLLLEEEQHCEHDGSVYNSAAVDFIIYMDEEEYNKKGSAESGIQPQVREVRIQPIQEEEEQQQKVGSSHQHQIIRKPTCSSSSSCALRRPPLSRNGPAVSRRSPYRSARRSFDFGATSNKEQQQQSPKVHGKFVTCSSSYLKGPPSSIDYGSVSNGEI